MNWVVLSIVLISLVFSIPIVLGGETSQICLDDNTMQTNTYMSIVTNDGLSNVVDIEENTTCDEGCSDTLKGCRWDDLTQVGYSAGLVSSFLMMSILGLYISAKMESPMFLAILPIVSVLSVFVAITDVFGTGYRAIFLGFTLVPIGLMYSGMFKEVEE